MITEDYILRMIQEMGQMLARILGSDALDPTDQVQLEALPAGDGLGFLEELKALCSHGQVNLAEDRLFEELDFSPTILCETNSVTATLRMAAEGIGVTFIGRSCENPDLSAVCYRLSPPLFRLNLLVRRKNWVLNPAETYLCRLIGSCFPQPDTQSEDSFRNPPPPAPSAPECGNI